jgi:RNA polymerase primary sigma factor
MNPSAQNKVLMLGMTPPEKHSSVAKQRRRAEKSDWALAIERLNEIFDPKTFSYAVLSFSECKSLAEVMLNEEQCFTDSQKQEARDLFINSNLKLVRQISLGYMKKYSLTPIEDLFQMGVIGLMRAVEKWDPDREFLFSTYATWWIRQSITRSAMDNETIIRLPIHMQERVNKVIAYEDQYFDFFNVWPDSQEASDALEIELDEYLNTKAAIYSFEPIQGVSKRDGELKVFATREHCLDESTSDPALLVEKTSLAEQLEAVLCGTTFREQRIIKQRYGLVDGIPKTLDEIGQEFGVTRERIRQIEAKTMAKLRHPSRTMSLRDFLDTEDSTREFLPAVETACWFRVGAEPTS